MVGHTHEDVDKNISCTLCRLGKTNVLTLLHYINEIGESYFPKMHVLMINFLFDVKAWMEKYTEPDLTGHVRQRQFKVRKELKIIFWSNTKETKTLTLQTVFAVKQP